MHRCLYVMYWYDTPYSLSKTGQWSLNRQGQNGQNRTTQPNSVGSDRCGYGCYLKIKPVSSIFICTPLWTETRTAKLDSILWGQIFDADFDLMTRISFRWLWRSIDIIRQPITRRIRICNRVITIRLINFHHDMDFRHALITRLSYLSRKQKIRLDYIRLD